MGFATKNTTEILDYFGEVSGNDEDKISKVGVHIVKSNFVDTKTFGSKNKKKFKIYIDISFKI